MGKRRAETLCKLVNKNLLFPSLQTLVSSPQCIWELEHHHRSLEGPISDQRDFCRNLLSRVCLVDLGDLDNKRQNMTGDNVKAKNVQSQILWNIYRYKNTK